jgi:predicted solute-binding protein
VAALERHYRLTTSITTSVILSRYLLKKRIFLHFLINRIQQLESAQLEKLDGLLKLGCHDQLLGKAKFLSKF